MNLANKISIARILMVPFFVASLVYYSQERGFFRFLALGIFIAAMLSDCVDGYVARMRGEKTTFGSIIDPIADKALLISAFILLALDKSYPQAYALPAWVLILVISRDVLILLGSLVIYVISGKLEVIPSRLGKAATFFQMLTVISILLFFPYSNLVWATMVLLTAASGAGYIIRGARLLNHAANKA